MRSMFVRNRELPGLLKAFGWTISVRTVCSTSFEAARGAGAESFVSSLCARVPFDFFVALFLVGFFDGDTFDLYSGSIYITRVTRRDGHQNVQAVHDLTEDRVPVIQMRRGTMRDKEL